MTNIKIKLIKLTKSFNIYLHYKIKKHMKPTTKTPDGTSFYDSTFDCSVAILRKILGEPDYECNDGSDKTNFDWTAETDNGDVFTVYDWKEYRPLSENEVVQWHIGGHNRGATEQARREIEKAISKMLR